MEAITKLIFTVLLAYVAAQNGETASNATTNQVRPLSCLRSEGIMANWQDETCSSYFVCDNFVLRIIHCEEGKAFSIMEHACVERSLVECEDQNNAVGLNVRAAAILRQTSDPSYVVPNLENEDPNNPLSEDERVGAMFHNMRNSKNSRSKRAALRTLGMPASSEAHATINVTLPDSICERIDSETPVIEALMNAILLTEAGCRDLSCGIPLLSLRCPAENDNDEEVVKSNATRTPTLANLIQLDNSNSTTVRDGANSTGALNSTLVAGDNRAANSSADATSSNIFGIFDVSDNSGNRNSETSDASDQRTGNSN